MLPLIEKEVVDRQKWVSQEEIIDIFAIIQSVPGVISINTSIFIGYRINKIRGAIAAALGVILPSFFIILLIAYLLFNIRGNAYMDKAFLGVRAGVAALIAITAAKLGKAIIKDRVGVALAAASFISIVVFDIHAILVIVSGGLIGYLVYGIRRSQKR